MIVRQATPADEHEIDEVIAAAFDGGDAELEIVHAIRALGIASAGLELVAEEVEFAIQWAPAVDRKSTQILGGLAELRAFIDAGNGEAGGSRSQRGSRHRNCSMPIRIGLDDGDQLAFGADVGP